MRRHISLCSLLVLALAFQGRAAMNVGNGWVIRKWSRETSCACGQVIRYYIQVERTGPGIGSIFINDGRSYDWSDSYVDGSIHSTPSTSYLGGGTSDYLAWNLTGMAQGSTFEAQYDVQLKDSLPYGALVRNYLQVNSDPYVPENHISVDYDLWVKLGNYTRNAKPSTAAVGEPVNAATGEFFLPPQTDLDLGGPLPLRFTRWYGSALNDPGYDLIGSALGLNWMHNFEVLAFRPASSWSMFVLAEGGKAVYFTEVYGGMNNWSLNCEQESVPYEFKVDGADFWFLDPARELAYRFDAVSWSYAKEVVDRNGNSLLIHRRADMLVTNVVDGLGRSLQFEYGSAGNLVRVTDGTRTVSYGYNADGVLSEVTNALGGATSYAYDPGNSFTNLNGPLMTSVCYPRGNVPYTQDYNTNGQVVCQADAYGNTSAFAYTSPTTGVMNVADPVGVVGTTHYDRRQVTHFTDQASNTIHLAYHAHDLVTNLVDRRGHAASFAYEEDSRRMTQSVDAGGGTTTYSYVWTDQIFTNREAPGASVAFAFRDLSAIAYPDGTSEYFGRDGHGNLTSRVDRAGGVWSFTYNGRGQVLTARNPRGGTQTFTYNVDGTLATVADTDTAASTLGYDALRRVTRLTRPDASVASWGFDAGDRLTVFTNRNGACTTFEYDANGGLTRRVDPAGHEARRQTDLLDRMTNRSDNLGPVQSMGYDSMSRLATATDPAGTTAYGYDVRGWATSLSRGGSTWRREYDADGGISNAVSPLGHRVSYRRDGFGQATQIVDQLRFTSDLAYDSMGRMVSARDPLGATTRLAYDAAGRLCAVTNPLGRAATFQRDGLGLVTRATGFDGQAWTYAYSPMGRPTAVTNPLGQATHLVYDTSGRLVRRDHADGSRTTFAYDAAGRLSHVSDPATNDWRYGYDARGLPAAATNPAGGVTRYTYRLDGLQETVRDTDTGPVSNRYDAARRLVQTILPDGAAFAYAYGTNHELLARTDPNGHTWRYTYDADLRVTSVGDPYSNLTWYAYDAAGRLTGRVDRAGASSRLEYDAAGRLTAVTDPTGLRTAYGYDAAGRRVTATLGGQTWRTAYDGSGRATNHVSPQGRAWALSYDAAGRLAAVADPLGRTRSVSRDSMGRATAVTDPLGLAHTWSYDSRGLPASAGDSGTPSACYDRDALGNVTRLADPNGNAWTFGYSAMGALDSTADPLNRTNRFTRNARGQVTQVAFPDGGTASRFYDPAGNVTQAVYSGGPSLTFSYDGLHLLAAADGLALQRDKEGRVTNTVSTADGRAFGADYDAAGRLVAARYNNGAFSVAYSYDPANGLLTGVSDTLSGGSLAFQYDADFRLAGMTRGNGVNVVYAYDDAGAVTHIADGAIADLRYGYDAAGSATSAVARTPLGAGPGLATLETDVNYDAAAQVASPGYAYDLSGRLTAAPGHAYTWDGASRLTGADGATLAYDGLGGLMTRTASGTTTRAYRNLAIGLGPIVAERNDTAGQFVRYYVWTPGGALLYAVDVAAGNKPRYYHFDRVGSTLAITAESGAVTDAYAYTPFGEIVRRQGGSTQPFTFAGRWGVRQEDAAGTLYQMQARYYDARLGRFLSRDPLWPDLANAQKINPYEYVGNQPVGRVDRTGLDWGTSVVVQNAGGANADVQVTYTNPKFHPSLSERQQSQLYFNYSPTLGGSTPIVAERQMYFNRTSAGLWSSSPAANGNVAGNWYSPEGPAQSGFDTLIAVQNLAEANAAAKVTYITSGSQPIVAERPMYFNRTSAGLWSSSPAANGNMPGNWYSPEGTAQSGFEAPVLLQNPAGASADFQITYMNPDSQSIVAERPMYSGSQTPGGGSTPIQFGQTYYWRVDEVTPPPAQGGQNDVWSFQQQQPGWHASTPVPGQTYYWRVDEVAPTPAQGGKDVSLSWRPGRQPSTPVPGQTYYWRVDEVAAPTAQGWQTGFQVQNLGASAPQVTIPFLKTPGMPCHTQPRSTSPVLQYTGPGGYGPIFPH